VYICTQLIFSVVTIDQAIVLHVSYLVLIIKYIDKYMPTKTLKRRQH